VEQIIIAIIGGLVAVIVAIVGMWSKSKQMETAHSDEDDGRPVSLTAKQYDKFLLMETLNSTVEAQSKQIDILRGIVDEQRLELTAREQEIEDLRNRVSNLERLTVQQALIISELKAGGKGIS
jgi:peptidoglycan hydrolase CwlO-like protein